MKANQHKSTTKKTLSIYASYTKRYRLEFGVAAGGAILAVIAQEMVPPFMVSRIFSKLQQLYAHHQPLNFSPFKGYFIVFAVSMFVGMGLWRLQAYFAWRLEENVRRDIANDIYDHLQSQSQSFHADRFAGALVSQTNKFLGSYERLMDDLIWNILPSITAVVGAIIVLLVISWPYALILMGIVALYLSIMSRRVINQMPYNQTVARRESEQTAALADAITNLGTVRAFAGEKYESQRFKRFSERLHNDYRVLSFEAFKTDALSHIQTNGFQVITLLAGLLAVTNFKTNVSLLYLLISYTQNIVNRLWQFNRLVRNTNRSLGDSTEMTQILGIKPEIVDPVTPEKVRMTRGEIRFKSVRFAYPENHKYPLFDNLDIRIKPGEKVGLVGPSGGGKTTITQLLLRFMDIDGGEIAIDGQNIASVKLSDLRSRISYVSQEPILFHRTLAENIKYGDVNADQRTIEGVSKLANAHQFIENLPSGYQTLVGERGVKLSGGQRQRVTIARAMLKNAPILVLDEATSALDSESEVLIQDALWKLMEGRTALVIAHRLSTIQKMDRIIVLENGRVMEEGSHKELLGMGGTYAKLWGHQSGGFMED